MRLIRYAGTVLDEILSARYELIVVRRARSLCSRFPRICLHYCSSAVGHEEILPFCKTSIKLSHASTKDYSHWLCNARSNRVT